MLKTIWKKNENEEYNKILDLSGNLNISTALAKLLINKGIAEIEDARKYLEPDLSHLINPFLLKDMDKAVQRIRYAIENKEKIFVWGDYDVDGISSSSIMILVLRRLGADVEYYLPNRFTEGYGLNKGGIQTIFDKGAKLIISVDCGITAIEEVKFCNSLGMDIVVTDHHEPAIVNEKEVIPDAYAVVDPKQKACKYPFKALAGAGVAYKTMCALASKMKGHDMDEYLSDYIDIAAFATVADLVPLKGENRVLVKYGLEMINKEDTRLGMRELKKVAGFSDKIVTAGSIGFQLAPRLNACGRMGDASVGVELFTTNDPQKAAEIAVFADTQNTERQAVEDGILNEALSMIAPPEEYTDNVIVLASRNWHAGIQGIVASKIQERYHRPVILGTIGHEDKIHCSARSIEGFNIHEGLTKCSSYLNRFGGHEQAAGLEIDLAKFEDFKVAFNKVAGEVLTPEDFIPKIKVDAEVNLSEVDFALFNEIKNMEPFGLGNSQPVIVCKNATAMVDGKAIGSSGQYLRLNVFESGTAMQCVCWKYGEEAENIKKNDKIDIAFKVGINEWNGKISMQLTLEDFKLHKDIQEKEDENIEVSQYVESLFKKADEIMQYSKYKNIGSADGFFTKVVGVTFDGRQDFITNLSEGQELILERQPNNAYDKNAIAVIGLDKFQMGFLNKDLAKELAKYMDMGIEYKCVLSSITGGNGNSSGLNVYIQRCTGNDEESDQLVANRSRMDNIKEGKELLETIEKSLLGGRGYREKQMEAISSVLSGNNTMVVMGTGRGKSAIFQTVASYLAIAKKQMTIIVYPLRALVNDQYASLQKQLKVLGIRTLKGVGDINQKDRFILWDKINNGGVDILLTTPEFLEYHKDKFERLKTKIGFLVVDESHNLGMSSATYRPSYRGLEGFIKDTEVPLTMAVTATSNEDVSAEIVRALSIKKLVIDPTVRKNIKIIDKRNISDKNNYIRYLINPLEKTIIYVNSKEQTIKLAEYLRNVCPEMKNQILYYNAGLPNEDRVKVEKMFMNGDIKVIVSTSAFGEGVNIPDIKHIVHYHLKFNFVEFNQQSGRAGRDGSQATVHILFGDADAKINDFILNQTSPDRGTLGYIYKFLSAHLKEKENHEDNLSNDELLDKLKIVYPALNIIDSTVIVALNVFSDLGLLEVVDEEYKRIIRLLPAPSQKLNLELSMSYLEGLREKQEFESFKTWVFNSSADDLLYAINQPIYPKSV